MITQYPLRPSFGVEWEARHTGYVEGKVADIISVFGYRSQWSSTTTQGDVCPYLVGGQETMNTPTSGQTLYIVSTSAQDATGGTGCDRLRVVYLDASGNQQIGTHNLNGLAAVSIGTGFTFIQWMECYHSVTAERTSAGNITISSTNGAALESTTFEMILAGRARSESMRYKVPTGKHGHLIDYHVSAVKQGSAQQFLCSMRANMFMDDGPSNTYHFIKTISIVDGSQYSEELHYKDVPEGVVVKMSVIPSTTVAGNIVRGGFEILVMDI